DSAARFVGRGHYNPGPALCCRLLTRRDEPIDAAFLARRIGAARARRGSVPAMTARRLVWREGGDLAGLVVDDYAGTLVVPCWALGVPRPRDDVLAARGRVLGERPVFGGDDPVAGRREGSPPQHDWVTAPGNATTLVDEAGVRLSVTFGAGHKTGLYLD